MAKAKKATARLTKKQRAKEKEFDKELKSKEDELDTLAPSNIAKPLKGGINRSIKKSK